MTLVHLVYIHGFQGNDTSFQSFPTDLQKHLSTQLPAVQTSIYPTYKTAKPLSFATHNFLEWLSTQRPGAVILLGHSMGGLLAAEAATDSSQDRTRPQRIIGVIAFDTPYLGLHPHVVISGIASLFSSKEEDKDTSQTNKEMNDQRHVHIVDERITDDWEEFKKNILHHSIPLPSPEPTTTTYSPQPSPLLNHTISFIAYGNPAFGHWLRKHADEPLIAAKRWIVEHFQFGSSMFDANGLRTRYGKLVAWDGKWINYWTETIPKSEEQKETQDGTESKTRNRTSTDGLLQPPIRADGSSSPTGSSESLVSFGSDVDVSDTEPEVTEDTKQTKDVKQPETEKAKSKDKKRRKRRHFVMRPDSLSRYGIGGAEKWELVTMAGVKDEVAAHCGLFIPGQNLDYDGLITKVGQRVVDWCKGL